MNESMCSNCGKNRLLVDTMCRYCRAWEVRRKNDEDEKRHDAMLSYFSHGGAKLNTLKSLRT